MAIISIDHALRLLKAHQPVALPTETVYGLAAPVFDQQALHRVFEIKQRPYFDPLIVHVINDEQINDLTLDWPSVYRVLTTRFWPGPLTLIAKRSSKIPDLVTSGADTVALRSPCHPVFLEVLTSLSQPLAAPSANRFKKTSPTTAQHVEDEFGGDFPVVDGGPCSIGIESTILRVSPTDNMSLEILRPGIITKQEIEITLEEAGAGSRVSHFYPAKPNTFLAPGQMIDHYQPAIPLRLIFDDPRSSNDLTKVSNAKEIELKLSDSPILAARELYAKMRSLSQLHPEGGMWFRVTKLHQAPDWASVLDRLVKASQKI